MLTQSSIIYSWYEDKNDVSTSLHGLHLDLRLLVLVQCMTCIRESYLSLCINQGGPTNSYKKNVPNIPLNQGLVSHNNSLVEIMVPLAASRAPPFDVMNFIFLIMEPSSFIGHWPSITFMNQINHVIVIFIWKWSSSPHLFFLCTATFSTSCSGSSIQSHEW